VAHGRKHLLAQLAVIEPKVIVLLGRVACLAMLEENVEVAKVHGTTLTRDGYRYMIVYHPAAPLHSPKLRVELKNDFKKLKRFIRTLG
jgi:uracil-DNA glycosylase family 4